MSVDKQIADAGFQTPAPSTPPPTRGWLWRWLSTGLIVAGVLFLGAGGVMAYLSLAVPAEPPPPVGRPEPTSLPSLEDNPLPVVSGDELTSQAVDAPAATPTPMLTPTLLPAAPQSGSHGVVPGAEQDVPSGPPPTPSPTPRPPAANPPTRIVAPAINLDAKAIPIGWKQVIQDGKPVSVWEVADYAAGWHENSALPGGGGNIVLSGHHNVKGEVFRYVIDLDLGDTITLYADGRPYTYTVESRFVVRDKGVPEEKRRENARWIGPFPDERLTLVTCWPYTNNTHRVIVIAKPTR